uniref:Aldolase citrate lyase family protein n=1 Tax=Mycena chlorophos TaxID=658473 RepID=A0ABQ0KWV5_MYCCL|nr:aldolase citrate lyase family protein [Mycena chlorophos]
MHSLLNAFKAQRPSLGIWLTSPGYFHARTVANAHPAIDWVCFDAEHGLVPGNGALLAESIAAIHNSPTGDGQAQAQAPSALVRVAATGINGTASTSWQIKHALDAGARGVVVPMVSTPAQAADAVQDSRFPPVGRRGFGSAYTQLNWGMSPVEYLAKANEGVLVIVQIETPEGLKNVREIAEVDGVDALLIGPFDLSLSLCYPPPNPDPVPAVEKEIQHIKEQAHAAGKKCAIYCTSGTQAARRVQEGFDMVNVIGDVGAITSAISTHFGIALGGSQT